MQQKRQRIIILLIVLFVLGAYGYSKIYPQYKRASILLSQEDVEPTFRQMLRSLTPDSDRAVLTFQDPVWEYKKYTRNVTSFRFTDDYYYKWHVNQGYIKADFDSIDLAKVNLTVLSEYYPLDNNHNFTAEQAIVTKREKAYPGANLNETGGVLFTEPRQYNINYTIRVNGDNFESGQFTIEIKYNCKSSCDDWEK